MTEEMEIFYYVAQCQSFAKAARKMGVSNSHISKKINKLESNLGVSLLSRSTRAMSITPREKRFYLIARK